MPNMNDKNLLDDTGREMVNALRRIEGALSGETPEMLAINYRDNNFNFLDRTGKQMVSTLLGIAGALESGGGGAVPPATPVRAGLMSAADKQKLDAFGEPATYVRIEMLEGLTGTGFVRTHEELPEGIPGQMVLVTSDGDLMLFDGETWICLSGTPIPEHDVLRIIEEETAGESVDEPTDGDG